MNGCMNDITERLLLWILSVGENPVFWGLLILLVVLWLCLIRRKRRNDDA